MQVCQIRQEYNLFMDFSESTTQYILLRFFLPLYTFLQYLVQPLSRYTPWLVGRLRVKIVHFFDKSVKIGTGVVWRMGNFLKPGTHLGCHGNRRPSWNSKWPPLNSLSGHISALICNRNTVSVSKTMFYGVRILFLIWKIASRRRPSWISRWPPCEIMFFRMTLVLNNLAKQCWCLYQHFQGPGIHLWHLQCH